MTHTSRWRYAWLIAALGLLPLMVSSDSLWIDEAYNASFARLDSFSSFVELLLRDTRSENQMPLGMLVPWLGGRLIGTSEWQLRAINFVWGALTIAAFFLVARRLQTPWLPFFVAVQPFFWFYTNEARPYALQIACGSWLLFAVVEFISEKGQGTMWAACLLIAGVMLCATSLLGVITFGSVCLLLAVLAWQTNWRPTRPAMICLISTFVLLIPLGLFYVWTLLRGAGGAKNWSVGFANIMFTLYEFGGFVGLGPGRQSLRVSGRDGGAGSLAASLLPYATGLIALGLCYAAIFITGWRQLRAWDVGRHLIALLVILVLAIGGTASLSVIVGFPFWGRHLAPCFPFFAALVGVLLKPISPNRWRLPAMLGVACTLLLLASSWQLRYASRHAKDNYREAARVARERLAAGDTVWWVADTAAARYYQLPLAPDKPAAGKATDVVNSRLAELTVYGLPDWIIFSKPDIYDGNGQVQEFFAAHGYRKTGEVQAFTFWQRP